MPCDPEELIRDQLANKYFRLFAKQNISELDTDEKQEEWWKKVLELELLEEEARNQDKQIFSLDSSGLDLWYDSTNRHVAMGSKLPGTETKERSTV